MSSSNCCFLTYIQVSQETGKVVWYSHVLKNFPKFIVIHTVKGFGVVNKAEVEIFLELSCFFDDPVDVGNLILNEASEWDLHQTTRRQADRDELMGFGVMCVGLCPVSVPLSLNHKLEIGRRAALGRLGTGPFLGWTLKGVPASEWPAPHSCSDQFLCLF